MDNLRYWLPFRFKIMPCKLLKTLYLFASLDPVNLNVTSA